MKEIINLRRECEKHFLKEDGLIEVQTFKEPIHYKKGTCYEEIDNTLEEKDGYYVNKSNSYRSYFSNVSNQVLLKVEQDNHYICYTLKDANEKKAMIQNTSKLYTDIKYQDILDGIDFEYNVEPVKVKENIIIKNKEALKDKITFFLDTDLELTLNDDKSILASFDGQVVFKIDAPFIIDDKGKVLECVSYALNKDTYYTLDLIIDRESIQDVTYPIIIDPTLTNSTSQNSVFDTFIYPNDTNASKGSLPYIKAGVDRVGNVNTVNRALLKFTLPNIGTGSQIVGAALCLYAYPLNGSEGFYQNEVLTVHKLKQDFNEATANWNTMNNQYKERIEAAFHSMRSNAANNSITDLFGCEADITSLVKKWYKDEAIHGVLIKQHNETYNGNACPMFFSKENGVSNADLKPLLVITYRNQNGLENYLDYKVQTFQIGNAYLNSYNGNLVTVFDIGKTISGKFPVACKLVYNTNDVTLNNNYGYGVGYRMSLGQLIKQVSIENITYLEYVDEDGTSHYFKPSNNIYYDEDGLDMTIVRENNSFILKDKTDNQMTFSIENNIGYLTQIKNNSNDIITISYNSNHTIREIVDGNGSVITFTYEADKITVVSPTEQTTITLSSGKPSSIISKTGTTLFAYQNGILSSITDESGLKVGYTYYSEAPYRVKKVTQYGLDNSIGQYFNVDYQNNSTTFTNSNGNVSTLTFNNYGTIESITNLKSGEVTTDALGKVLEYGTNEYGHSPQTKNKILYDTDSQGTVKNYANNSSFENSNLSGSSWNGLSASVSSSHAVSGFKSLKLVSNGDNQKFYFNIKNVSKGKPYTFSGYFKNNKAIKLCLGILNTSIKEEIIIPKNDDFERYDITFDYPTSASNILAAWVTLDNATTCYVDDIQLEEGQTVNNYNFLEANIYDDFSTWDKWGMNNETGQDVNLDAFHMVELDNGNKAIKISMDPSNSTGIARTLPICGKAGDVYQVSFFYKSEGIGENSSFLEEIMNSVLISFNYLSEDNGHGISPSKMFNPNEKEWQYFSALFIAEADFDSINLLFMQNRNANDLYITNLCVFKDVRSVDYEYDEKGNMTSVNDMTNWTNQLTYNKKNQLSMISDSKNIPNMVEYSKEVSDRMISISNGNVTQKAKYDDSGNVIQETLIHTAPQRINNRIEEGIYKLRIKGTNEYVCCRPASIILTQKECSHCNWLIKQSGSSYLLCHPVLNSAKLTISNGNVCVLNSGTLLDIEDAQEGKIFLKVHNENRYLKRTSNSLTVAPLEEITDNFEFYIENDNGEFIETDYKYTEDGKYIDTVVDSLLHKTKYNYNSKGMLTSKIDANGNTISYEYNDKDQLVNVETGNRQINYTYNIKNMLNSIIRGTQTYTFEYDEFLNPIQTKINGVTLSTNTYENQNGNIASTEYANNQSVSYDYDELKRLKRETYSDNNYNYIYNKNGLLSLVKSNNSIEKFQYDLAKRITKYATDDFKIKYFYTDDGNIEKIVYELEDEKHIVNYNFNSEELIANTSFDNQNINYQYDRLGRLSSSSGIVENYYTYEKNGKRTSNLIKNKNNYTYIYNRVNNITHIYHGSILEHKYYYDDYNLLIREKNYVLNQELVYSYDNFGNILSKKIYSLIDNSLIEEKLYTYNNSNWLDQLTSYDNISITYDAIGNPITIGNATLTWQRGKRLGQYCEGSLQVDYTYNQNKYRTSKIVNGVETKYYLQDNTIIFEKTGSNVIYYMYDVMGNLVGFQYNDSVYYYELDNLYNVVAIKDCNGNLVATYTYDSWGKVISIKDINGDEITSSSHIALINPFRYKSYYYDSETKLYYLGNRYYNPEWGRFLNTDDCIATSDNIMSYNLYVYANNDPINNIELNGALSLKSLKKSAKKAIDKVANKVKTAVKEAANAVKNNFVGNVGVGLGLSKNISILLDQVSLKFGVYEDMTMLIQDGKITSSHQLSQGIKLKIFKYELSYGSTYFHEPHNTKNIDKSISHTFVFPSPYTIVECENTIKSSPFSATRSDKGIVQNGKQTFVGYSRDSHEIVGYHADIGFNIPWSK